MPTIPNIERHPLQPFLPKDARLLMLGSFPPPRTLRSSMSAPQTRAPHLPLTQCTAFREMRLYRFWCMDFFYPNPQNDMWRIMGQVFFGEYLETTFAGRYIRFWRMPSTSRAYPLSLDKKAVAYQNMFAEIGILES